MTRVLINDCHQRLARYNLEIEQSKCHLWTAVGEESKDIELTSLRHAQKVRVKRDKELSTKLEKLRVPNPDNSSGVLVHNLSSKPLTGTQLAVLERGATFNTADAAPTEFIAAFESVLQLTRASEETKDLIRHQTSSLLMRHKRCETLSNVEQRALKSLKANKDIIILPDDKGRSTVVLDKSDYQNKVQDLLEDQHSYKQCRASEMESLITRINKGLKNLKTNDWFSMKPTDIATARFYGLPKFLAEGSPTTVASANQFLERIKHVKLEPDESMVSFDVVSLFTSIPQQIAIDVVDQLLAECYEERDKPLKSEHLLELLRYCLKTYFTFGGQLYEQIKGTPMGFPLSGLIAEVVLRRIEHLVFAKYQPMFWARYVDDTFVVVKTADIEHLKELLNSVDPDIQFTMEAEANNQLPFLDVLVRRCTTGQLQTAVVRKSTDTRQILHFNSNHPLSHKPQVKEMAGRPVDEVNPGAFVAFSVHQHGGEHKTEGGRREDAAVFYAVGHCEFLRDSSIVRDACHHAIMELTYHLPESSGTDKSPHDIPHFVTIHPVECIRQIHERKLQVGPHLLTLYLQLVGGEDPVHGATITAKAALTFRENTLIQVLLQAVKKNVSEYLTGNVQQADASVVVTNLAISYPFV
ncbi:hypothetical protein SprV_ctg2602921800 [Sparganum proliferum]